MCASLFYHPPLDPLIGICVLRLLVLRAHHNSAVYLISPRYGPNYPYLRLTVINAVPVSRYSNRNFFSARTMRMRLVLDSLLPPRSLLLPRYFFSPAGLSHALAVVAALPLYAYAFVGERQSVAAGRVIARFVFSRPLSVSSLGAALRVTRPSRARAPPLLRLPRGFIARSPHRLTRYALVYVYVSACAACSAFSAQMLSRWQRSRRLLRAADAE